MGYTGNGDLVCVIEGTGEVVTIDHENNSNEIFMNSSVPKLEECLLEYYEFIKRRKLVNGSKAFLKGHTTEELLEWITEKIMEIDRTALQEKCFLREELDRYKI